jgi:hypothetical protein
VRIPNAGAGRPAILPCVKLSVKWGPWAGRHGGQPGGLPECSRWSYPLALTTTGKPGPRAEHPEGCARPGPNELHPGPRAEAQKPVWHLLPGCRNSPAPLPGGRRPQNSRRPPATLWQSFGLHHRLPAPFLSLLFSAPVRIMAKGPTGFGPNRAFLGGRRTSSRPAAARAQLILTKKACPVSGPD